jgi:hypothetical protein
LVSLIEQAIALKSNPQAFLSLVWSEPFCQMRDYFEGLVKDCNTYATDIPVPVGLVDQMTRHRDKASLHAIAEAMPLLHPALDRIEERQTHAMTLYGGTAAERNQFVALAAEQMEDYSLLIQSIMEPPEKKFSGELW